MTVNLKQWCTTTFKMKLRNKLYLGYNNNMLGLLLFALADLQQSMIASAYNIVSMKDACSSTSLHRNEVHLSAYGSNSAASLFFDVLDRGLEPRICVVNIHAASTHVISLHLGPLTPTPTTKKDVFEFGANKSRRKYQQACPLSVFSLGKGGKTPRLLRSVDLCDAAALTTLSELYSRQHLTVVWTPPHANFSDAIQAAELVVTAVGVGRPKHSNLVPAHFPCFRQRDRTTSYYISGALLCDGRRNCPEEGEDEDPVLCAALATRTAAHNQSQLDSNDVATPVLTGQQFNVSTTEITAVEKETESFPEALAHYGPWGYLMLGMLICGTVLMVCGVWECCCRRHKTPSTTPATPNTIFVITPECPPEETSLPPAYDDLDQPPAYNILFPVPYKVVLPTVTDISEVQRTEI